mgnify:CR=1 FL=1
MTSIKVPSWRKISDQIISTLPPEWKSYLSGKVFKRLIVGFSLALEQAYGLLERVFRLSLWKTSKGIYLRALARSWGMEAYGGAKSSVEVEFTRYNTESLQTVEKGAIVITEGGVQFELLESITFSAAPESDSQTLLGSCLAVQSGSGGNVPANSVIVSRISGVEVNNLAPSSGGDDPEDDEKLRSRLPAHLATLHRATPEAIAARLNNSDIYPEIKDFRIEPFFLIPGYFKVVVLDASPESYKVKNWEGLENNQYKASVSFTNVNGAIVNTNPAQRLGFQVKTAEGLLRWQDSFQLPVGGGAYRWRMQDGNLQVYLGGQNPNDFEIIVYSGLLDRIYRDLERDWVATGVQFDIVPPSVDRILVDVSFILETGFDRNVVKRNLTTAISDYLRQLKLGEAFQIESAFRQLSEVEGAFGVLIESPESNIIPPDRSTVIMPSEVRVRQR